MTSWSWSDNESGPSSGDWDTTIARIWSCNKNYMYRHHEAKAEDIEKEIDNVTPQPSASTPLAFQYQSVPDSFDDNQPDPYPLHRPLWHDRQKLAKPSPMFLAMNIDEEIEKETSAASLTPQSHNYMEDQAAMLPEAAQNWIDTRHERSQILHHSHPLPAPSLTPPQHSFAIPHEWSWACESNESVLRGSAITGSARVL